MRWLLAAAIFGVAQPAQAVECVVLLHGLGRSAWAMQALQWSLERDGYMTWNEGYDSTSAPIEELAGVVGTAVDSCRRRNATRVHLVTHSLGGILVRRYFQDGALDGIGRVVMLAPPNQGSEVVDAYRNESWFSWATGPAGQQLGTRGMVRELKPLPLEIGVIAGTSSSDPWFSSLFDDDHDGKVSVKDAALPEMKALLRVNSGHTFMTYSPTVVDAVRNFLRYGAFAKPT